MADDERLPADMQSALSRSSFIIPMKYLEIQEQIGAGAFSKVYKGIYNGKEVAIKKQKVSKDDGTEKYLHTELAILTALKHPNLIKYYGAAFENKTTIYMITELLHGGDLSTLLSKHTEVNLPWQLRVRIAKEISEAIDNLHERQLIHRDIKTENILIDSDWRPVLADYGFARKASTSAAMTMCGTDEFMAPEMLFGEKYDEKADVFSFGMVLAELIVRKPPGKDGFLERHPREKFEINFDDFNAAIPKDCPVSLLECCKQCLAYNPEDRLESDAVAEWLRDLYSEKYGDRVEPVPSPLDILGSAAIGSSGHLKAKHEELQEHIMQRANQDGTGSPNKLASGPAVGSGHARKPQSLPGIAEEEES